MFVHSEGRRGAVPFNARQTCAWCDKLGHVAADCLEVYYTPLVKDAVRVSQKFKKYQCSLCNGKFKFKKKRQIQEKEN